MSDTSSQVRTARVPTPSQGTPDREDGPLSGAPADSESNATAIAPSESLLEPGSSTEELRDGAEPAAIAGDDRTVISSTPPAGFSPSGTQSSAELGRLLIGEQLDHFLLEEYVGGGGMGAVFRATDTLLGRAVAVKVLSRQHAIDEETTRRFRNEAQSAARLDHENIARVYFVGVDRGWHYIVLEYVEGENVRDMVSRHGPMPVPNALEIVLQVAEALQHAASRDVVHRDVKPSNVLVTSDGHVKLVDMGLARLRQVEQSVEDITATGVTLGTFDYISPEQARDPRAADVRSDLYSLGCTMYYMLCARPPFPEGTVLQKLLQHQGDQAPDCRQLREDIPDCVAEIVHKLLSKNPQDRYQQPQDLIGDLLLACEQLGIQLNRRRTAVFIPSLDEGGHWTQRHLPWMAPVALLIAAVLGIQYFGGSSQLPPPRMPQADATAVPPQDRNVAAGTNRPDGRAGAEKSAASDDGKRTASKQSNAQPQDEPTAVSKDPRRNPPDAPAPSPSSPKHDGGPMGPPSEKTDTAAREEVLPSGLTESSAIVAITAGKKRAFSTLAEACREALSGSVVELRYDGRREEQPLSISNRELTIRAADGFHPIVAFRPETYDPLLAPGGMLTVTGGELTLVNVELELQMPTRIRSEPWVLVEAVSANRLRLERCMLTVSGSAAQRGAYSQEAHFVVAKGAPNREMTTVATVGPKPLSIELRNCIVRGDASVLAGDALHTVTLQWENGLLLTSDSLVDLRGTDEVLPPSAQLQIDLQHVTARMGRGMCRMATREDGQYLPLVKINCTDCILMTDGAPLIDQQGDEPAEEMQKALLWKGNRNFYEGIDVFWRLDGPRTAGPTELSWIAWRDHWGTGREMVDRGSSVAFAQLPSPQHPKATQTPADYLLDESELYNPALGSATDGTANVGQKIELLPHTRRAAAPAVREAEPSTKLPPRPLPEIQPTPPPEE